MNNQAFIDGQNLTAGTTLSDTPWRVDLCRLRKYLDRKYSVTKAYYFMGHYIEEQEKIYDVIQKAGFILIFRPHFPNSPSGKKGNVDTDIVFYMMRNFHEDESISKFYLISGDGDYFRTIDYLFRKEKLGRVLFPARDKASSLYHKFNNSYYDFLDKPSLKSKIELKEQKRGSSLR